MKLLEYSKKNTKKLIAKISSEEAINQVKLNREKELKKQKKKEQKEIQQREKEICKANIERKIKELEARNFRGIIYN